MSFTDRKPFVVEKENYFRKPFCCGLCGCDFTEGDTVRWVYANSTPKHVTGNFFVCSNCDIGSDAEIIQRSIDGYGEFLKDAKTKYKRFVELLKRQ